MCRILQHTQPKTSQPAAKTLAAKNDPKANWEANLQSNPENKSGGNQEDNSGTAKPTIHTKRDNFLHQSNSKKLETTHNMKTRNTEMTQQETSNMTIQTMNEPLRTSTRPENITKDHINRQAEPQQAALTMRDNATEARMPHTERQKANDSWDHQLNPKQPATI